MPHIDLEGYLPGITGLLAYRLDSAAPVRALTQVLLRGPSTLTEGERELIATVVSHGNQCRFCTTAHTATADKLLGGSDISDQVKRDISSASVSKKMKALLTIAREAGKSGKNVTPDLIEKAKTVGATDVEIHDTVLIAALFCFYNRYVDGLNTVTPQGPEFYDRLAERLVNNGYKKPPQ